MKTKITEQELAALIRASRNALDLLDHWPEAELKPGSVREAVILEGRGALRSALAHCPIHP